MLKPPSDALLSGLQELLGPQGFSRDLLAMEPWLTDWRGRYCGAAAALLMPTSTEEVRDIVSRCAAESVALVPQGGNTSMVGGATPCEQGGALLLSLRRMNRIRSVSADDNLLVAEAGVILSHVHDAAAEAGRRFPLSLGAKGSATIGGLISTNAGGTQVLRFGPMRSLVLGVEAVLPDGSLWSGVSALRKDNRGYDIGQLLIGAEGTLGVVTAASLRLLPAAGARAVAWVGLDTPHAALALLHALEERLGSGVESFELVPAKCLDLVLAHIQRTRPPLGARAPWNVLVETVSAAATLPAKAELEKALSDALECGLITDAAVAASESQAAALWHLRESIAEAERHSGSAIKHDISVPVSEMPAFVEEVSAKVEARFPGSSVLAFGHLGDGNVHFNVQAPEPRGGWDAECGAAVTRFVHDAVGARGGSISAEHGIGQMKREEYGRTAPQARLAAQRLIKQALDPQGIMNPGKLFPCGEPG